MLYEFIFDGEIKYFMDEKLYCLFESRLKLKDCKSIILLRVFLIIFHNPLPGFFFALLWKKLFIGWQFFDIIHRAISLTGFIIGIYSQERNKSSKLRRIRLN